MTNRYWQVYTNVSNNDKASGADLRAMEQRKADPHRADTTDRHE
jgi:hypothetical protein